MKVLRMPQTDAVAVAEGCFDLPQAQGVQISTDESTGLLTCTCNLVTLWENDVTDEQIAEIVRTKKVKTYVRIVAAVTPPLAVTVDNPFDLYDDLITLKEAMKMEQETAQPAKIPAPSKN